MSTHHLDGSQKYTEDGKVNPAFLESVVNMVNEIFGGRQKPDQGPSLCKKCETTPVLMHERQGTESQYYYECVCGTNAALTRDSQEKAMVAWDAKQIVDKYQGESPVDLT